MFVASGVLLISAVPIYKLYQRNSVSASDVAPTLIPQSDQNKIPTRIRILDLNIDLPIKKAKLFKGIWEVFDDSAAYGEGSSIPAQKGNIIIFAHARKGLFLPLLDVKKGMEIIISTNTGEYSYRVEKIEKVDPFNLEYIKPIEDREILTLYTCTGFADIKRLIVQAQRN